MRQGQTARARDIFETTLDAAYTAHRAGVDALVSEGNATFAGLDSLAGRADIAPKAKLAGVGLITLFVVGLIGWMVVRHVLISLERTVSAMTAAGTGDLTVRTGITVQDEFGRIAQALDALLQSFRHSITEISTNATSLSATAEELTPAGPQRHDRGGTRRRSGERLRRGRQ